VGQTGNPKNTKRDQASRLVELRTELARKFAEHLPSAGEKKTVSLSMTTMRPPHLGQSQSGLDSWAGEARGLGCDGCTGLST